MSAIIDAAKEEFYIFRSLGDGILVVDEITNDEVSNADMDVKTLHILYPAFQFELLDRYADVVIIGISRRRGKE